MSLILFDQNTPRGLRSVLAAHEVRTALQMGWDALVNGALIAAAEAAGFDILVTADRNMQHQQNLSGRRLALVVLGINHWPTIKPMAQAVRDAVDNAQAGSFTIVPFPPPPLRRRIPPPPSSAD
jgi:putative NIF3 family GTP cyclohydrolase 1 type 2